MSTLHFSFLKHARREDRSAGQKYDAFFYHFVYFGVTPSSAQV